MTQTTKTGRAYELIFDLLAQHPDGVRWKDILAHVKQTDPSLHPKTVNGCVWKLTEKYPDSVYKPEKGVFRLTKFK